MRLSLVQKQLFTLILIVFFIGTMPYSIVQAYANPNTNVFDCLNNEKDCEKEKTPAADRTTNEAAEGLSTWDFIKVLFAFIFVIGLLFSLLKFVNRKNRMYDKNRLMKNMGGISLGQHKSIQLVVIGNTYYLIGVGDDIRLLKEINDPAEIDKLSDFYDEDGLKYSNGMLERLLVKLSGVGKKDSTSPVEDPSNFSNMFKSRLDEMKEERKRHLSRLTEKERNKDE